MPLKAPRRVYRKVNIRKDLKKYTYRGCPMTNNRTPWCFRLCKPLADGTGLCGRVAPHGFKSRIQQGIDDFKRKQAGTSTLLRYQKPTCGKEG